MAPTETYEPSGSRGVDTPVPSTESAPRRFPEQESRNPPPTESARRRCPEVGVPWVEAPEIQRGHCEDIDVGVATAGGFSSNLQSKFGLSPTWTQCVSRVSRGVAGDRDVDQLVDPHWRQHLRGLPVEVAEIKRWKSG